MLVNTSVCCSTHTLRTWPGKPLGLGHIKHLLTSSVVGTSESLILGFQWRFSSPDSDVKQKMSKTGVAIRAPSAACESFLACAGSYSRPHVPGVRAPVIGLTCVPVLASQHSLWHLGGHTWISCTPPNHRSCSLSSQTACLALTSPLTQAFWFGFVQQTNAFANVVSHHVDVYV